MNTLELLQILEQTKAGGIVAIAVVIFLIIEIIPEKYIKFSPLEWVGKRVNKNISDELKTMNGRIDEIDGKLNAHMVESYRTNILDFSDKVMDGQHIYTHDKWRAMLKMCGQYEHMIETEHLINGDATEAIEYIKKEYQKCCNEGKFIGFPKN